MIPEKLYIPTSTLNFNNIMSSESISPVSFYDKRKYGYKRFEKVEPNNFDNIIILYNKYPIFDIYDNKLENYPLVIEIDTRFISEDCVLEKNGIFYTSKYLYFNPFSTRIIFRNESERNASLSKAEPSIESKLIPLYQGQFVILSSDIESFEWNPIDVDDLPIYDNNAVSFDIAINKLKGMLYGYLLGANSSSSPKVVSLKQKVKELRNVLSAVLASPDGSATHYQEQLLNNLYNGINQDLYGLSDVPSQINKVIAQKIEHYNAPTFVEILKGEGLYQEWLQKQISLLDLRYYHIMPFCLSHQATDKVAELDNYINSIDTTIRSYDVKGKLDMSKMPVIQNRHILEIPDQKEFLSTLFGEYLDEVWNGAEFLSSRYYFARVGGKLFREKTGDNWEKSPARTYINSLLKNLNEYAEFDINSTDSIILKSFAAFCQKGESDIDKLKDYLISNGIGDFRIAFALWGLIFGFAEMPKTLTNDLFENQDEIYISDCYKYIYKQLHSIELKGDLDRTPKKEEKPNYIWQDMKHIGKKVGELFTGKTREKSPEISIANGKDENTNIIEKADNYDNDVESILRLIYSQPDYKDKYKPLCKKIEQLGIKDWDTIEGLGKWKGFISKLRPDRRKQAKPSRPSQNNLYKQETMNFMQESSPLFKYDPNAWNIIKDIIPNDGWKNSKGKTRRELIEEDLRWYQNSNMSIGDNKKDIVRFCDKFKTQPDKNGKQQGQYYTLELRKAIKERLLSLYCNND